MKDRIANYLKTADLGRCTRASVAKHLGIANSTFGRHLKKNGITFTELLNGERIRRLECLNEMAPKQISYELECKHCGCHKADHNPEPAQPEGLPPINEELEKVVDDLVGATYGEAVPMPAQPEPVGFDEQGTEMDWLETNYPTLADHLLRMASDGTTGTWHEWNDFMGSVMQLSRAGQASTTDALDAKRYRLIRQYTSLGFLRQILLDPPNCSRSMMSEIDERIDEALLGEVEE